MTIVIGPIRLPKLILLKGRKFPARLSILKVVARRLQLRTPHGISQEDALNFLRHFKPVFGEIKLLKSKMDPKTGLCDWKIAVDSYACPNCHLRFDLKDVKVITTSKMVQCPKCGMDVVEKDAEPVKLFHL